MVRYRIRKADDGDDIYHVQQEGAWLGWVLLFGIVVFGLIPFWIQTNREIARGERSTERLQMAGDIWQGGYAKTPDGEQLDFGTILDCIGVLQESGLTRTEIEDSVVDENNVFHPQCR